MDEKELPDSTIGAVVLKVNRKILKINFYLVDYKAKDAFNTFYVI